MAQRILGLVVALVVCCLLCASPAHAAGEGLVRNMIESMSQREINQESRAAAREIVKELAESRKVKGDSVTDLLQQLPPSVQKEVVQKMHAVLSRLETKMDSYMLSFTADEVKYLKHLLEVTDETKLTAKERVLRDKVKERWGPSGPHLDIQGNELSQYVVDRFEEQIRLLKDFDVKVPSKFLVYAQALQKNKKLGKLVAPLEYEVIGALEERQEHERKQSTLILKKDDEEELDPVKKHLEKAKRSYFLQRSILASTLARHVGKENYMAWHNELSIPFNKGMIESSMRLIKQKYQDEGYIVDNSDVSFIGMVEYDDAVQLMNNVRKDAEEIYLSNSKSGLPRRAVVPYNFDVEGDFIPAYLVEVLRDYNRILRVSETLRQTVQRQLSMADLEYVNHLEKQGPSSFWENALLNEAERSKVKNEKIEEGKEEKEEPKSIVFPWENVEQKDDVNTDIPGPVDNS